MSEATINNRINMLNSGYPTPSAPPPSHQVDNVRIEQMLRVQCEALELFANKNADYGDSFATYGAVGVIVRMGDKISRLSNITNKGITLVEDEKIRDTLIDLYNYAAMAIMLLDEKKSE